jgi:peptidoglycan hydrolase-like protein with peptidoglycan-binding domain
VAEDSGIGGSPAGGGGGGAGGKTVNLPVFGKTKTVYVYGAAAVVAVVVAYAYWKRSQGLDGGAEETSYYADLRTGSSTGDDAYEGANDSVTGTGGSSYYDSLPAVPTTDQQWTAAVVASLTHYEPDYLYSVLGKYLARQPLGSDEQTLVRAAWAAVGRPPGGQQIITATDTSTPGTSKAPTAPTGLKLASITHNTIRFTWTPVSGATSYRVHRNDGASATATGAAFTTATLKPNTPYAFTVEAINNYGTSPKSAALSTRTKAAPTTTKPTPKPPAKTPPVSSGSVKRTLNRGDRGNDVKIVQRKVGAKADGIFGPDTEKKVKAWQARNGLKADGIVGPLTQAKMGI